ncbi:MAG: Calx-beta domain-containing protein, partial [Alphaproteobacteria bacterium]
MGDYAGLTVQGADRYDNLGRTVADAGDINGDGIGDFIVSAPYASQFDEVYGFSGSAYVVFGSTDGPADLNVDALDGTNGFRIIADGAPSGDGSYANADYYAIGTFADGVGDINGDGIDDIVVAGRTARSYANTQYARPNFIYVIFGRDADVDGDFNATVNVADLGQPDAADGFQVTGVDGIVNDISSAGDVNGDGLGDLLISQSPLTANGYGGYYGYYQAAALAIDPNADPTSDPEVGFQGFVLFGASDIDALGAVDVADLDGSNGFRVLTERSDISRGYFGEGGFNNSELGAISSIGDVNGDGFDDIVIRTLVAKNDSPYGGNYGTSVESRAFILFGKSTDVSTGFPFNQNVDPSTSFDVTEVNWNSVSFNSYYSSGGINDNVSIRGIGDINGDGFDDVAVGNPNRTLDDVDGGQDASGIDSVYFGGPQGVDFDLDRDTDNNGISDGLNVNGTPEPGNQFSADLIIVNSDGRFDFFGGVVVAAGDVNGDGIGDFAIAAPRAYSFDDVQDRPSVFLIFGRDDVGVTPQVIDLDNLDQATADQTGYRFIHDDDSFFNDLNLAISAAGDIDGDGVDDLLLGVPYAAVAGLPFGGRYAGEAYVVYGGLDALEAADNADGANDNVINVKNLAVDVETGVLPIEVSVRNSGQFSIFRNEGNAGATVFEFEVQRTGDLSAAVSFDFDVTGFGVRPANAADFFGGVLPSGTASFAAGEAIATVQIEVQGDEIIEDHEDFRFAISNAQTDSASPISIAADETFARIFNDDFPITFFAFNTEVTEGDPGDDRVLSFEVVRTGPGFAASVDFAVSGGTADAADFEPGELPRSGVLNFADGEFRKTVDFRIAEDLNTELNETLFLSLSNAPSASASARIGDGFAVGTIFTDDFPPQILVSGDGFVTEGTGPGFTPVTFTIERRGETDGVTEVTYALNPLPAPGDFFAADSNDIEGFLPSFGNVVRFEDGESIKTVTVNIVRDGIIEPREDFELRVTEVQSFNGVTYDVLTPSARVTIFNDDGRPPVIPPGIESDVFGDPHIITLDGLGYDFQAVGEYILVETEAGAANPFQVQVRFEPLPGSDLVSVTTRMAVEINGVTVELDALGADTLLIDGAAPDAAALALGAIDVDGDGTADVFFNEALNEFTVVLNDENEQLFVKNMDGVLNICVFLADSADGNAGNVRGLMGDGESDGTADDLALRDGTTVLTQPVDFDTIYGVYADSWRLDGSAADKTALFSNTVTFPEGFPAAALKLDDLPADLRAAAEAAAIAAGLDPEEEPEIFNAAVLDFALTGDGNFFAGALGLAAEATAGTEPANAPALPATVGVTAGEAAIVEGDAGVQSALFTFYRIGDPSGEVTVDYAIGGGVDAGDLEAGTALTGQVTFAAGETSKSISIGVQGDLATEGDEKLTVSITGKSDPNALVGASQVSTLVQTDDFAPEAAD